MPDGSSWKSSRCSWCEEVVRDTDDVRWIPHLGEAGHATQMPWHVECFFRHIMGGLNHLKGQCSCCGGTEPPDPPGMTAREAAIAAWRYYAMFPASADKAIRRAYERRINRHHDTQ